MYTLKSLKEKSTIVLNDIRVVVPATEEGVEITNFEYIMSADLKKFVEKGFIEATKGEVNPYEPNFAIDESASSDSDSDSSDSKEGQDQKDLSGN